MSHLTPGNTSATSPSTTRTFSEIFATFFFSHSVASGLFSTAMTLVLGASVAIASASAPEPDPRSITEISPVTFSSKFLTCVSMASTSSSLSGRGTNTPGPTSISRCRK